MVLQNQYLIFKQLTLFRNVHHGSAKGKSRHPPASWKVLWRRDQRSNDTLCSQRVLHAWSQTIRLVLKHFWNRLETLKANTIKLATSCGFIIMSLGAHKILKKFKRHKCGHENASLDASACFTSMIGNR